MCPNRTHPLPFNIMLIEQPPKILRWLYPSALWRMNPNEKSVYLTFDDGPIPNITPWVLDLLDHHRKLDRRTFRWDSCAIRRLGIANAIF